MEWISQKKRLLNADLEEFRFDSGYPCLIQTTRLQRDGSVSLENKGGPYDLYINSYLSTRTKYRLLKTGLTPQSKNTETGLNRRVTDLGAEVIRLARKYESN